MRHTRFASLNRAFHLSPVRPLFSGMCQNVRGPEKRGAPFWFPFTPAQRSEYNLKNAHSYSSCLEAKQTGRKFHLTQGCPDLENCRQGFLLLLFSVIETFPLGQTVDEPDIPGPSKRNIFLLITLFLLILPIERNFRNLRGNCKFHVPHPFCGKSCKFGHQKCAEIGGKCAEIGGKCAEIGGKWAEIGGKPKTNLF